MTRGTLSVTKLCDVPPDDGALTRALDDVDSALSAWVAAVEEANARLAALAGALSSEPPASAESAAAPETSGDDADTSGEPVGQVEPVAVESVAEAGTGPPDDPSDEVPSAPDDALPPPAEEPEPQAGEPPAPAADEPDDDAALLASLDPQTAQAIRVLQRMSIRKRSVRELLEQYEATKHRAPAEATQRRGWFSRRK